MRSSALFLAAVVLTATLAPEMAFTQDLPLAPLRGTDQGMAEEEGGSSNGSANR